MAIGSKARLFHRSIGDDWDVDDLLRCKITLQGKIVVIVNGLPMVAYYCGGGVDERERFFLGHVALSETCVDRCLSREPATNVVQERERHACVLSHYRG